MGGKLREGILATIGKTPLVALQRIASARDLRVLAKLEFFNPGGSIKDRPAMTMIEHAWEQGRIGPGSTVVESSSGNMAIGLAVVCRHFGLRFICVVDAKATRHNVDLLRTYGAEIEMVLEPNSVTGDYLTARIARVQELLRRLPGTFWPDQYSNRCNAFAHHETMQEIVEETGGRIDYLFCATSTCGTIQGCWEYAVHRGMPVKLVAVDAVGSVIFGGRPGPRLIPGHGASRKPELLTPGIVHKCVHVTDLDCIAGCRRLLRDETILAGGSSGGVISALEQMEHQIPRGSHCVLIFPDGGDRYLDTIYSDAWVEKHFGAVSHLWHSAQETWHG
jgi:cysteine synthase A